MADTRSVWSWDDFEGTRQWSSTTPDAFGWNIRTHGGGSPTATAVNPSANGIIALACDTSTAAQSIVLSDNDVLSYASQLQQTPLVVGTQIFKAVVGFANLDANCSFFLGMTGADNATLTSITPRVGFNIGANGFVEIDSVNSTVSNSAVSTLYSVQSGYQYLFQICFAVPQALTFSITQINGFSQYTVGKVLGSTTFDFHNYTGSLQRYFRSGKSAGSTSATSSTSIV